MDVDQVEDDVLLRTPSEQSEEVTDDARSERSSITVNTLTERLKMMGESFSNTSASDKVTEPTQQEMMGKEVTALLDTGSEISIVPLAVLKRARLEGVDLDQYVQRIPRVDAVIRNASGTVMHFLDTVRLQVKLHGKTVTVPFYIGDRLDEVVILGTNALELLGLKLLTVTETDNEPDTSWLARVKERTFIPAHSSRKVEIESSLPAGDYVLLANDNSIESDLFVPFIDRDVDIEGREMFRYNNPPHGCDPYI
ncbi:unnamed protein product [Nippostrongylus brasiliensis]|uniref:Peptidase A2 domain-containing protein n=1 Tax=Nippostrongylus brasiliensis TaxID=27835 RepID=A0A158QX53_NIPBR|nr:unnamed protein product [Nippostrongylus brasiliensis]